jgi:hypothetical protein
VCCVCVCEGECHKTEMLGTAMCVSCVCVRESVCARGCAASNETTHSHAVDVWAL